MTQRNYTAEPGEDLTPSAVWGPGIAAGVTAAIPMALFAMVLATLKGAGFFAPMKLIAATALGRAALHGGPGTILLGIAIHLAIGAAFGIVFAAIVPRYANATAVFFASLLYVTLVFAAMTYLVLPWADSTMYHRIDQGWFFAYHLVYGTSLALLIASQRSVSHTIHAHQH